MKLLVLTDSPRSKFVEIANHAGATRTSLKPEKDGRVGEGLLGGDCFVICIEHASTTRLIDGKVTGLRREGIGGQYGMNWYSKEEQA